MRLANEACIESFENMATDRVESESAAVFRAFSAHNAWDRSQQLELLECYFGVDAVEIVLHFLEAAASPRETWLFLEDVGAQPPASVSQSRQPAVGAA